MTVIITRSGKGSPLTWIEADSNFTNLNNDKLEANFPATQVANTPSGTVAATNIQAAINELDTEKAPIASPTFTGTVTSPQNYNVSETYGALQVGGADVLRFGSDTSGQLKPFRNILYNADFRINQRAYVSNAVLAAGAYGHDRFKAGASGGDYSFTQLPSSTQITIASGKSLIQVVENKNVVGGSYVLSWEGTAKARVGLNSAIPSGNYAASPILITGQTAGTVISVEFNTGTLGKAQLEEGSIATPFEQRPIGLELSLCQRYYALLTQYQRHYASGAGYVLQQSVHYGVMQATPSVALVSAGTVTNSTPSCSAGSNGYVILTSSSVATGDAIVSGRVYSLTAEL